MADVANGAARSIDFDTPMFVSDAGSYGSDPLALCADPQISRAKLALFVANPVVETNVGAPCPWKSVERVRLRPRLATRTPANPDELSIRFAASVARAMGSAETVALLYSGGLDSFALTVEVARQCREQGRRLIPIIWDAADDAGVSAASVALPQLRAIADWLEPVVLDTKSEGLPEPGWSSRGPRSDWHAPLRRMTEELADSEHASVILSGAGGDEVFSAWNYGTRSLLVGRRFKDLVHYLAAFVRHDTIAEVVGEILSIGTRRVTGTASFRTYLALACREELNPDPGGVVHPQLRVAVERAHVDWLRGRLEVFKTERQDWSEAMFFDQVYPFAYDAYQLDAMVPERSPYLDVELMAWASGLPFTARFDSSTSHPYHWYKALQIRLIPPQLRPLMPTYKAFYGGACHEYLSRHPPAGPFALHEHEVLVPVAFEALRDRHGYLPLAVRNLELWLRGALDRGYAVTD